MSETRTVIMPWENDIDPAELFGPNNSNIAMIEENFSVNINYNGDGLHITGEDKDIDAAKKAIKSLIKLIRQGNPIDETLANYVTHLQPAQGKEDESFETVVTHTYKGKPIRTKTFGQKAYVTNVRNNEITFAIGPAGTGKTYLAMAMAINAFKNSDVTRIVLVRPAVEAGESLGFLPGDLKDKVDPYLRPLYDSLYDIMGLDAGQRNIERGAIEIAPLAYMRGRTLDNSFIILDEAQNTSPEQMKMFLTRLGFGSKAVITGDITQIDLPFKERSGLLDVADILKGVRGIAFSYLTQADVVRNPIVQRIINAYERNEKN